MRYNILLFITRSAHPKCFIIGPLEYQLMSKSVEKMRKASRSMSILLTALGLLFIGLLILIVLTTSEHPPEVIFMFLSFSILMFLMAYAHPIIVTRLEANRGWSRPANPLRFLEFVFLPIVLLLVYVILDIVWFTWERGYDFLSMDFIFVQLFFLILLATFLLLPHRLRRIRILYNGFECKAYPDLSRKNIDLPAYFLKKHGIASTSIGAEKHGRWVTFNEVLSLDHGVMVRIRFPKAVSRKVRQTALIPASR